MTTNGRELITDNPVPIRVYSRPFAVLSPPHPRYQRYPQSNFGCGRAALGLSALSAVQLLRPVENVAGQCESQRIRAIACLKDRAPLRWNVDSLAARLARIQEERDPNRKNLQVAELVSQLFRETGADPVIVGGSAVEFYTDGTYVSGDVDVCFDGARLPSPRDRELALAPIGTPLGSRKWRVADVFVDLLGAVETEARTSFQKLGELKLIQIEALIAERILIAVYPERDAERRKVAKILLAGVLNDLIECDRMELERVVNSPGYAVGEELRRLIDEIEAEIQSPPKVSPR